MEAENNRLQQELQDARDQNELLEFRNLELEVTDALLTVDLVENKMSALALDTSFNQGFTQVL